MPDYVQVDWRSIKGEWNPDDIPSGIAITVKGKETITGDPVAFSFANDLAGITQEVMETSANDNLYTFDEP